MPSWWGKGPELSLAELGGGAPVSRLGLARYCVTAGRSLHPSVEQHTVWVAVLSSPFGASLPGARELTLPPPRGSAGLVAAVVCACGPRGHRGPGAEVALLHPTGTGADFSLPGFLLSPLLFGCAWLLDRG